MDDLVGGLVRAVEGVKDFGGEGEACFGVSTAGFCAYGAVAFD